MHTLFLVTNYPCREALSAGVFHQTSAEALTRFGVNVTVLAPVPWVPPGWNRFNSRWNRYAQIPLRYEMNGVTIERPRYLQFPKGDYWFAQHLAFAKAAHLTASRYECDIIHAHYPYPCGLAAIAAGRRLGVPAMVTLHGSDVNSFPDVSPRTQRLFCKAIHEANVVTAVGQALAERTQARTSRMPIHLPIGIQLQRFLNAPTKEVARQRLNLPHGVIVVLYAGTFSENKGVPELLQALESLTEIPILGLFVGDGPLRPIVQNSVVARCDGPCSNQAMPTYLAAADLLVLPSHSEGLSTVLVEAGAVGVPILATAVPGIAELLENGRGWLVPSRSAAALAQGIREIHGDFAVAQQRANKFRSHVKHYYDADRNAARLAELYDSIRHRTGRAGSK